MPQDELFRWFFGDESPFRGGEMRTPRQHGLGSGVIVTKDGYILTNNHVVENADTDGIKVLLNDGREFTAKPVGKDAATDIAVLKINADNLPFLTLGDSDKAEVGDLVLAIGNPFNVGLTVTTGIISAKGRTLPADSADTRRLEDFLQTDAAINPGNSGGPLVDAEGRLIGINTAIISSGGFVGMGGNVGIGFAVPSNLARFVMDSVIKDGRVVRGYMGLWLQPLNEALAKEFKLKSAQGAVVTEVTPGSPAERAGLKSGDVIVEFNGKPVEDSRTLSLRAAQTAPGSRVPVKLIRDGDEKTVQVTLKEFPSESGVAAKPGRDEGRSEEGLEGVTVTDLDRAARSQLRIPATVNGALVARIDPESASYEAGLREGDVILEINRKPVSNADEAVALSERVKNETALLRVWSRGGSRYIVVDQKKG
jgi:serine protease Do